MQWSQIKTLFILCFLILDIYLIIQFLDKQESADIGVLERQDSTIEQQLEDENIKYSNLPEKLPDETFISVKQKEFSDEDLQKLEKLTNQKTKVIDNNFIVSQFDKPVPIPKNASTEEVTKIVKSKIIYPEDYVYGDYFEEMNVLLFFQKKNDRPIYYNQNGMILVFLNNKHEMISYTQTMLGEAQSKEDKRTLIKPIKAIGTLYGSNLLNTGEEVTSMDIGYHTRVPLENGVQVFVPTWKVTVNGKRNYFVNAIEGFVFTSEDAQFLNDVISSNLEKIRKLDEKSKTKENMMNQLEEKVELYKRSEVE